MIAPVISPAILLAAGLFASPVIISDVALTEESERLRVTIQATGGIDPEAAQTAVVDGRLLLQLGGTRVKADRRSWPLESGDEEIRAHRHSQYTELVVPLAGSHCAGPVELAPSDHGLTAYVGCDRTRVARRKPAAAKALAQPATEATPETNRASDATAQAVAGAKVSPANAANRGKLEALVALGDAPEQRGSAVPEKALGPAAAPVNAASANAAATAPITVAGMPKDAPGPRAAEKALTAEASAPAQPSRARTPNPSTSEDRTPKSGGEVEAGPSASRDGGSKGLGATVIPAIVLAALAVAAYLFARRRRVLVPRTIEIVETASLGPKRALVVARVGDETLILGSSEAGISLLKIAGNAGEPAASAPGSSPGVALPEAEQSLTEALADIPEPEVTAPVAMPGRAAFRSIDGGAGGPRLAHPEGAGRRDTTIAAESGRAWGPQGPHGDDAKSELRSGEARDRFERLGDEDLTVPGDSAAFQDLLEDSFEDQELRQKLAAGLAARVR